MQLHLARDAITVHWRPLLLTYSYALSLLFIAEVVLRRKLKVSQDLSRKFVHIGAGLFVFAIVSLFSARGPLGQHEEEVLRLAGLLPFASFIFVNAALYFTRLLPSVDSPNATPGTIWFAAVITFLFSWLWRPVQADTTDDLSPVAVAAVMAMTLGDALAALIGSRYGKMRYRVRLLKASVRSYEGSTVMLVVSWFAMAFSLWFLGFASGSGGAIKSGSTWRRSMGLVSDANRPEGSPQGIDFASALLVSFFPAVLATVAEAVSPFGLDNVLVPLVSATALLWTTGRQGKEGMTGF